MTTKKKQADGLANFAVAKIIFMAILSVLTCGALVLGAISFGMNMQRNIDERNNKRAEQAKVFSIIGVSYDSQSISYEYNSADDASSSNYLFKKLGLDQESNSYVIDSVTKLENVIGAIKSLGGDINYSVDSDFFNSGTIILVNVEDSNPFSVKTKSVARDENYDLQIDLSKKTDKGDANATRIHGGAVLVKVQNIKPQKVDVKIINE